MSLPVSATWIDLAWNGTVFCAIANGSAYAATSTDGLTWSQRTLPVSASWNAIAWNGTVFCAVASNSSVAATSPDGITWTQRTLPASDKWADITWNGTVFCAVAYNSTNVATSPDGITWTLGTLPSAIGWNAVAWNGSTFLATASGSSTCATSTDGLTWTARSLSLSASWAGLLGMSGAFYVVASGGTDARYTPDGLTTYARTMPVSASWTDIAYDGTQLVAIAYSSNIAATCPGNGSSGAASWTQRNLSATSGWNAIVWNGSIFCVVGSGTLSAVSADGINWSTAVPAVTGQPAAPTLLTIADSNAVTAATLLTVEWPTGVPSAPTRLDMVGSGAPSAPTVLAVLSSADMPIWRARCLIDGVDVSARLEGQIVVEASEGAARIATVRIVPPSGAVAPLDYVGKTISLDYVRVAGGTELPQRIFTGRIDTPSYDPDTTQLELQCLDDLQNRVAALDRAVIDGLVGGRYTPAVQGEILDNWDYAVARLSTVAASLDADASGGIRVTAWQSANVWATLGESQLLYRRTRIAYPQRSTLVNRVNVSFDYRYPRLRQRNTVIGWSGTQVDMAPCGWAYPTQQDFLGAAGGSGWQVVQGVFYPAPAAIPHASGGYIYPAEGSIDMAILHMAQRHSQTVTESYAIEVAAPESITLNGELAHEIRGALASSFDGTAWEAALDVAPLMDGGGEQDYAPDAPRSASDEAINTLLDQAKVKILGSHRGARVTNAILCDPDLDLDKHIAISTTALDATGKVVRVVHTLDLEAGSALSEFDLACFGIGGAGIITPSTLTPPAPPASAVETQDWAAEAPSLTVNTFGITPYSDSLMGLLLNPPQSIVVDNIPDVGSKSFPNPYYTAGSYPVQGFRVAMPGVSDADRNPLTKSVAQSYQVVIPADTLQFNVP